MDRFLLQHSLYLAASGSRLAARLPRSARETIRSFRLRPPPVITGQHGFPFRMIPQELNRCWAAVAVSVVDFYSPTGRGLRTPERFALLVEGDCCANPNVPACSHLKSLRCILQQYTPHYSRARDVSSGVLSNIAQEIENDLLVRGRPVCCRVLLNCTRGHFVAIAGITPKGRFVVFDPQGAGQLVLSPDRLLQGFGGCQDPGAQTWTHAYFTEP